MPCVTVDSSSRCFERANYCYNEDQPPSSKINWFSCRIADYPFEEPAFVGLFQYSCSPQRIISAAPPYHRMIPTVLRSESLPHLCCGTSSGVVGGAPLIGMLSSRLAVEFALRRCVSPSFSAWQVFNVLGRQSFRTDCGCSGILFSYSDWILGPTGFLSRLCHGHRWIWGLAELAPVNVSMCLHMCLISLIDFCRLFLFQQYLVEAYTY